MSQSPAYSYRNPWFTPGKAWMGAEFYATDTKPIEYRGFQIFHRHDAVWELVKDGVCLTQRAGKNGPRNLADALLGDKDKDCKFNVQRARAIAAQHGVTFAHRVPA